MSLQSEVWITHVCPDQAEIWAFDAICSVVPVLETTGPLPAPHDSSITAVLTLISLGAFYLPKRSISPKPQETCFLRVIKWKEPQNPQNIWIDKTIKWVLQINTFGKKNVFAYLNILNIFQNNNYLPKIYSCSFYVHFGLYFQSCAVNKFFSNVF